MAQDWQDPAPSVKGTISVGFAVWNIRIRLGPFHDRVTSSLGFKPSRHEGKIVGLAAYDDLLDLNPPERTVVSIPVCCT